MSAVVTQHIIDTVPFFSGFQNIQILGFQKLEAGLVIDHSSFPCNIFIFTEHDNSFT